MAAEVDGKKEGRVSGRMDVGASRAVEAKGVALGMGNEGGVVEGVTIGVEPSEGTNDVDPAENLDMLTAGAGAARNS